MRAYQIEEEKGIERPICDSCKGQRAVIELIIGDLENNTAENLCEECWRSAVLDVEDELPAAVEAGAQGAIAVAEKEATS